MKTSYFGISCHPGVLPPEHLASWHLAPWPSGILAYLFGVIFLMVTCLLAPLSSSISARWLLGVQATQRARQPAT